MLDLGDQVAPSVEMAASGEGTYTGREATVPFVYTTL
jgi:hypothetical protein